MNNMDENLSGDNISEFLNNSNDEETNETTVDEKDTENIANEGDIALSQEESHNEKIETESLEEINEEVKEEVNSDEDEYIKKYKNQIADDKIEYEKVILSCKDWENKIKELMDNANKAFAETEVIVDEFNNKISSLIENSSDEEIKAVENRQKGINMINRMSQNVLKNLMNRSLKLEEVSFEELNCDEDVSNKREEELNRITNSNYSIISKIRNYKRSLIDKYISFITINILPIIDGIQSGITFIRNSERKIIKEEIVPVYNKLDETFEELLTKCNIRKLDVNVNDKVDIRLVEIIEVEYTNKREFDEKVESIIRNGYEYLEDIYGTGNNHILRQAQIIAFKHE